MCLSRQYFDHSGEPLCTAEHTELANSNVELGKKVVVGPSTKAEYRG